MKVKVEFSGGLELMFNNKKNLDLDIVEGTMDQGGVVTTKDLLLEDVIEELKERKPIMPQQRRTLGKNS